MPSPPDSPRRHAFGRKRGIHNRDGDNRRMAYPTLDPAAAGVVHAWAGRYRKRGDLKRFVRATVAAAAPGARSQLATYGARSSPSSVSCSALRNATRLDFSCANCCRKCCTSSRSSPHNAWRLKRWRWRLNPGLSELLLAALAHHMANHGPAPTEMGNQRPGPGQHHGHRHLLGAPALAEVMAAVRVHRAYGHRWDCGVMQAAAPQAMDMRSMTLLAEEHFGLEFPTPDAGHRYRRNSLGRAVRKLLALGLVERLHTPGTTGNPAIWRWKEQLPRLAEAAASARQVEST